MTGAMEEEMLRGVSMDDEGRWRRVGVVLGGGDKRLIPSHKSDVDSNLGVILQGNPSFR